jgi:hypothetical protein
MNWPRCETALEEAASQVGADASSWSAPKNKSSSLLEEPSADDMLLILLYAST